MKSISFIYCILICLGLSFSSCKKKVKLSFDETPVVVGEKEITQVTSPADSIVTDFKFLQAKMKATAILNGSVQSFNTVMRWEKGKRIWMSMSLFGIEGVRALIDSSGIQWVDRMNNEYHSLPMNKVASKINMDLDFAAMERLLLGLPVIKDTLPTEVTTSDQWLRWNTIHRNGFTSNAVFNRINNMLIEYQAQNLVQQRNLSAKYGDIRQVGNGLFSFERLIRISQGSALFEMQSKFSEVAILDELNFPFEISDKYKKIEY